VSTLNYEVADPGVPSRHRLPSAAFTIIFSDWPTNPVAEKSAEFVRLADEWERATAGLPRVVDKINHASYLKIVGWGDEAIPHILGDLRDREEPRHWFEALHRITGANPVAPKDRGNLRKMAEAWLRWGRSRGKTQ
jgi:hypothetical protein